MKIKLIISLVVCSVFQAQAGNLSDIMDDIDNDIDGTCELRAEAGSALQAMSNDLVSEVNSRISSILDAYNLECLSSLLSIGGINIPGFDTIVNLDFCEIARDQILGGGSNGVFGMTSGSTGVPAETRARAKANILKKANMVDDLVKQLKKKNGG